MLETPPEFFSHIWFDAVSFRRSVSFGSDVSEFNVPNETSFRCVSVPLRVECDCSVLDESEINCHYHVGIEFFPQESVVTTKWSDGGGKTAKQRGCSNRRRSQRKSSPVAIKSDLETKAANLIEDVLKSKLVVP